MTLTREEVKKLGLDKKSVITEDDLNGYDGISPLAFTDDCDALKSITIPNNIKYIGQSAFDGCDNLQSVTILDDGVESIGENAFHNCTSLQSIKIPDSVTSIEEDAFRYCENLQSITIPYGVTSIGEYVFCGCTSLKSIYCHTKSMYDKLIAEQQNEQQFPKTCSIIPILGYVDSKGNMIDSTDMIQK